jgi:hypothetical protein
MLDLRDIEKLDKIAKDVHQNAVDKGWWPLDEQGKARWGARNIGEIMMLASSELAEALEVWRDGKNLTESWKNDKGKPEGYPIEMADFVIRVIETMVACGSNLKASFKLVISRSLMSDADDELNGVPIHPVENVGESLMIMNTKIAAAYDLSRDMDFDPNEIYTSPTGKISFPTVLASAVVCAFEESQRAGFDMWKAIEEKHAYNKTRPVRHGGKLA